MAKAIVVLGGGVGGLVAANHLRAKLPGEHTITVIDRKDHYEFTPSFPWVVVGRREPESVRKPLGLLTRRGIRFVQAEAQRIDAKKKIVRTSSGDFRFDYLVVALGAEPLAEAIPGLKEAAHEFYSLEGATRLREEIARFEKGKIVLCITRLPFKCPAAPYEMALLLDDYFEKKGLRGKIDISVWTPEPIPMPAAGPAVGTALRSMLEKRAVRFHSQAKLARVDAGRKMLEFENGERTGFDLLIAVPPHFAPEVLRRSGLLDESGWVSVNKETLETKFRNILALGDNALVKIAGGKALPKAGVFAHFEADAVADNIAARIRGERPRARFNGKGFCFIQLRWGSAGFAEGNFFAEPSPAVRLYPPGFWWHWARVLFEKWWLWRWL
ncbi:MAG: FAD/NAD(P)-binding oxidoreductase [Candidatus Micrarchaeia archaeon]